jgi:hypothetical protein
MDHAQPESSESQPVATGHEPSEVGIRRIFSFGGALVLMVVVVMSALVLVMGIFSKDEKQLGANRPRLFDVKDPGLYPAPNLQRDDEYELRDYRAKERAALADYGWVDPKAGIAHIPIDRAIDILAERGLPKPAPKPKADPAPVEPSKK